MNIDPLKISSMHDGALPKVFRNASTLRDNMTEPEKKLWEFLKTKPRGFKFRRQHPISVYVLDFYCHRLKLSIELDGGYHLKSEQKQKDAERTQYLMDIGITEIRFTNEQIMKDYQNVIENIIDKLHQTPL